MKQIKFAKEHFKRDIILWRNHTNRLSLREASKKTGVSPATLSRLENGKMPDLVTYFKVCFAISSSPLKYIK